MDKILDPLLGVGVFNSDGAMWKWASMSFNILWALGNIYTAQVPPRNDPAFLLKRSYLTL